MAEAEKRGAAGVATADEGDKEEERFLGGVTVLDFDMLCSTVAMQTEGKYRKLQVHDEGEGGQDKEFGGILRMWEGELLDCFEDRRIALESACCPCYRFGKNMRRAGFGSCFVQGLVYFIFAAAALINYTAFILKRRNLFLFLGIAFSVSIGAYLGFYRTQIRKKFNIRGSDGSLDDCVYHLTCTCCTLCQESRTLEMNNVQDGTWHGRGDTILVGGYGEGNKSIFSLQPPPVILINPPNHYSPQKNTGNGDHSWALEVVHSSPSVAPQH